jgi:hypothetical protein
VISGLTTAAFLFSGCATIVGGSKYYAHVKVENHPNASISYKGNIKGMGTAVFKAPRVHADAFSVSVKEDSCEEQKFNFTERTFRGWALAGTILFWTGEINGIPLPWCVMLDVSTGAFWKSDKTEKGITKIDYKNYIYKINYTGCKQEDINTNNSQIVITAKTERLAELKELLDKWLLSKEQYEDEIKKIEENK